MSSYIPLKCQWLSPSTTKSLMIGCQICDAQQLCLECSSSFAFATLSPNITLLFASAANWAGHNLSTRAFHGEICPLPKYRTIPLITQLYFKSTKLNAPHPTTPCPQTTPPMPPAPISSIHHASDGDITAAAVAAAFHRGLIT